MLSTLNINLYAGPGVGKSTTAAMLFVALKMKGISAEMVYEYAKELLYRGRLDTPPQYEIVPNQFERQDLFQGKVQVVITDAPVPLSLAYCNATERADLEPKVRAWTKDWVSLDVLLCRDLRKGYEQSGRYQSCDEAINFHNEVLAPFVRGYVGPALLELQVEQSVDRLVAEVERYLSK